jgi:hypothetical protein
VLARTVYVMSVLLPGGCCTVAALPTHFSIALLIQYSTVGILCHTGRHEGQDPKGRFSGRNILYVFDVRPSCFTRGTVRREGIENYGLENL